MGEGGDLSFTSCVSGFDGTNSVGHCGANDSTFSNSHVARKGGAVAIGSGDLVTYMAFHRCLLVNVTTVS